MLRAWLGLGLGSGLGLGLGVGVGVECGGVPLRLPSSAISTKVVTREGSLTSAASAAIERISIW